MSSSYSRRNNKNKISTTQPFVFPNQNVLLSGISPHWESLAFEPDHNASPEIPFNSPMCILNRNQNLPKETISSMFHSSAHAVPLSHRLTVPPRPMTCPSVPAKKLPCLLSNETMSESCQRDYSSFFPGAPNNSILLLLLFFCLLDIQVMACPVTWLIPNELSDKVVTGEGGISKLLMRFEKTRPEMHYDVNGIKKSLIWLLFGIFLKCFGGLASFLMSLCATSRIMRKPSLNFVFK